MFKFINASDTLIAAGNITIQNSGTIDMTNGGKLEVKGNRDDQLSVAGLGFKDGIGNVILTRTTTQTITTAKTAELFYNLKINKASGIISLLKNITVDNNLTLSKGIFVTNNNLFTWSNISGAIILPETYTDSYICTCNANGSPVTPTGGNGFRINSVRDNTDQMFPVSSDFVSPNSNLFVNVATTGTADVPSYIGNGFNTEIYGRYFMNVSSDNQGNKNGISAFDKFSIVNIGNIILPVTLTNIKAYPKNNTIEIDWTALNELNMDHYEVERSANSISFNSIASVNAHNNVIAESYYHVADKKSVPGNNFYRIKAVDKKGQISYSAIVKVNTGIGRSSIAVQPNPVLNKIINLQLNNIAAGNYTIVISNISGEQIYSRKIEHGGGNTMQQIILPPSVACGVYMMNVFNKVANYNIRAIIE